MRSIELLAPAANAEVARQAILHGADAVYIGGPAFGARANACNSVEDIAEVCRFAHIYGVKVYVTVNTIIYDNELRRAERMISDLYKAGVDALIVQDMGILRMDIPPIALHASTQCDIRTPEKARFLQEAGFSQIVLARELTIQEIRDICRAVSIGVECFAHGALCVSYSGKCHASCAATGRSANRGECAQICRLPYSLTDSSGRRLATDRHLLSLKDFYTLDRIHEMLEAGVSSFKIEGRLKDAAYVKNIVAAYRRAIDREIDAAPQLYRRSSYGVSRIEFTPQPEKSFNRGFTHYFLDGRRPKEIWQPTTPKSMGEEIADISRLHNGDGISFFNARGEYEGVMVNGVRGGQIIGNRPFVLPKGAVIHRTSDREWQQLMARPTATRRLKLDVEIAAKYVSAMDEQGNFAAIPMDAEIEPAHSDSQDIQRYFAKLGNTEYELRDFCNLLPGGSFIRASELTRLRRQLIETLRRASAAAYRYDRRRKENPDAVIDYLDSKNLDFRENVANEKARRFYKDHGAHKIEAALELTGRERLKEGGVHVMTTRHCILREMGLCLKRGGGEKVKMPLTLQSGRIRLRVDCDCVACEMRVTSLKDAAAKV